MGTNNYRYILVDTKGAGFEIRPKELNAGQDMNINYPRFDDNLTLDANVHMFNALFNSNRELLENLIYLYNKNENNIPLNPDDYVCVKLISKEIVNSYSLPIYHHGTEENKGNLLMPIIYKSDLDHVDHQSKTAYNDNKFYDFDLVHPDALTFYERIPSPSFLNKSSFYSDVYSYLLKCFKKMYNVIFAAENKYGRKVRLQDIDGKFISLDDADIFNILYNTVSIENNGINRKINQGVFSKYFPQGHFFYRLVLDIMIMSKRVYLVNDGKCSFKQIFMPSTITERYFIYSKEELIDEAEKLRKKYKLIEDEQEIMADVFDDVKESTINKKSEEENMQDFINKINSHFDGVRPNYIPRETEEDLLPFKYREVEEDRTPEDYYSVEDYYYNHEIRDAIDLKDNDGLIYSDLDERHDRSR